MSLTLLQSENYFFIKSDNFIDSGSKTLVIERHKHHIFEVKDDELLKSVNKISEGPIFGIVGTVNIIGQNYLCVIKETQLVGKLYGAHIYKITDTKFYPFYMTQVHQVSSYIDELKKYLREGFYFSYGYDLTASRQRRVKFLQQKSKDKMRIIACDHRYFWNINLYKDFQEQNVDCRWYTPLIQGFIGIISGKLGNRDIQLALISRRQHLRGGTRYNARGIDDQGNVANFVETEQILRVNNLVFSYVIIRGSVPVFWEQKGMIEGVTLTRGPEMTKRAFQKHFEDILTTYGRTHIIDLLSDTKAREIVLTKEYVRQIFESIYKDKLKFLHFDFHRFCSGDNYQALKVLIGKIGEGLTEFGFFVEDVDAKKIMRMQDGVFRVNCLDSLDRTNVAQSKIGLMILQKILIKVGYNIEEIFGQQCQRDGLAFSDIDKPVIQRLKEYWASQGDFLSKQYVGTASTISKVSRDGKEGFVGKIQHKMKNVQRYFINTLSENPAQDSIDIILGQHAKSNISSKLRKYLELELKKREDLYTEIQTLKVFVGTWNLGGVKTYDSIDLTSWLFPFLDSFIPDIVIVGFQEIVSLNAASVLTGNNSASVKQWQELVLNTLNKDKIDYALIDEEELVGLYIALFAKKSLQHRLTDLATSKIKLGFSGKMGNKGATLIRFFLEDTSFCFINCHLDSGSGVLESKKRSTQLGEIFTNAFVKDRGTSNISYSLSNHHIKVLFGDLNFRISLDNFTARKLIQIQDYEELLRHDEFRQCQKDCDILKNFKEGSLIFDPTYKYNFNSTTYDDSNKARTPSWCDRILFDAESNLSQIYYGRSEIRISDHRPVYGLFEAKVRRINEEAKQEIEQKLIEKYKSLHPVNQQVVYSSPQAQSESNLLTKTLSDIEYQQQHQQPQQQQIQQMERNSLISLTPQQQKQKIQFHESAIEPSIGDFGLLETSNQENSQSPLKAEEELDQQMIELKLSDDKELQELIIQSSVLLTGEELKRHQGEVYQEVLNGQRVETEITLIEKESKNQFKLKLQDQIEEEDKIQIFENEEDEQVNQNEERRMLLEDMEGDSPPQKNKKMVIFNDSDDEYGNEGVEEEKQYDEIKNHSKKKVSSPLRVISMQNQIVQQNMVDIEKVQKKKLFFEEEDESNDPTLSYRENNQVNMIQSLNMT